MSTTASFETPIKNFGCNSRRITAAASEEKEAPGAPRKMFRCPLCVRTFRDMSKANDPFPLPLYMGEVVCDDCFDTIVAPARKLNDMGEYEEMERFIELTTGLQWC